jgi:hypothetical protein
MAETIATTVEKIGFLTVKKYVIPSENVTDYSTGILGLRKDRACPSIFPWNLRRIRKNNPSKKSDIPHQDMLLLRLRSRRFLPQRLT